jgi:hypothetical protein
MIVCEDPCGNQYKEGKKLESDTNSPSIQDSVITQARLAIDSRPPFPDRAATAGSESEKYLKS